MAIDTSVYTRQSQGIQNDYASKSATNAYSRFLSQQRGSRGITDYQTQFNRQLPGITAKYGKRGLATGGVQSGVYGKAMQTYVGDYQQNLNRQLSDQQTDLRQYDLTEAQLSSARDKALSDMETDKAKEIAMAASYLAALKPQFG
jgi:hypothetical protein